MYKTFSSASAPLQTPIHTCAREYSPPLNLPRQRVDFVLIFFFFVFQNISDCNADIALTKGAPLCILIVFAREGDDAREDQVSDYRKSSAELENSLAALAREQTAAFSLSLAHNVTKGVIEIYPSFARRVSRPLSNFRRGDFSRGYVYIYICIRAPRPISKIAIFGSWISKFARGRTERANGGTV